MDNRLTPLPTEALAPPASITVPGEEPAAETTRIQFRSVEAVFQVLDELRLKDEDFAVVNGVSARSFAAIDRARERRSTHERLHYRPGDQQLFISIPTQQHDRTSSGLTTALVVTLERMGVSYTEYSLGLATTYKSAGGGGSGEGDQVFVPPVRDATPGRWPTLVVEIGVTQAPDDLRRKMAWWFAASNHEVNIVILAKVVRSARTVLLDTYTTNVQPPRSGATATRSMSHRVPQLRQSLTIAPRPGTTAAENLFDVVGAPLVLEFAPLFLRPADPSRGEHDVEIPAHPLAWMAAQALR